MQTQLLYRVEEAARLLALSRSKLYLEIARGRLKVVHIGSAARIPASELERYVRELQAAAGVS